jgi:hypothetical protein
MTLCLKDNPHVLVSLILAVMLAGCAAQKPKAAVPIEHKCTGATPFWNPVDKMCQNVPYCPPQGCAPIPAAQEPVPGHPRLHFGPEHLECDGFNNCEWVRNWLTAEGKPVLTPVGCFLAKLRVTWIFGDRTSMCVRKP